MATLIDRLTYRGDAADTEGMIDQQMFRGALDLYEAGDVDAQYMKTLFGMTPEQQAGLDELVATMPDAVADPVGRARWVERTMARFLAGFLNGQGYPWPGFDDTAMMRAKLGLPAIVV